MYRGQTGVGVLVLSAVVGGCGFPKSSNPSVSISSARVGADAAILDLTVHNPSDYDLHVDRMSYQLVYGPLPVATGVWELHTNLPKGQSVTFTQTATFNAPVLDPEAASVELSGTMVVYPVGGTSAQAFTNTAFSESAPAIR